jgi:stress response protein YsnF
VGSRRSPSVADLDGKRGKLVRLEAAKSAQPLAIVLLDGVEISVPFELLQHDEHDGYIMPARWSDFANATDVAASIPVIAQRVTVGVRAVPSEQLRVRRRIVKETQDVEVPLVRERLEVTRTPVGIFVDQAPEPRQEGDTWVIPCIEEVPVVVKRLRVREELRIRLVREPHMHRETVVLRRHEVELVNEAPNSPVSKKRKGEKS